MDVEATQMNAIQKTMLSMLVWLRVGVGLAGLTLPFVLVGCGEFNHVHWADAAVHQNGRAQLYDYVQLRRAKPIDKEELYGRCHAN